MIHNHPRPGTLHDGFCRCRACKPPLVGEASAARLVALILASIIIGSIAVVATIALTVMG